MNSFNPLRGGSNEGPNDMNSRDQLVNDMFGNAYYVVREVYLRHGLLDELYKLIMQYGLTTNVAVKSPVEAVVTTNNSLYGNQTLTWESYSGSHTVFGTTGMRVLVLGQDDPQENGVYNVQSLKWTRAVDFDGPMAALDGTLVFSAQGDAWQLKSPTFRVVIGETPITFQAIDFFAREAVATATKKALEAANSAAEALASEIAAKAAQESANLSEQEASTSAITAVAAANSASTSETNAKESELKAKTSEVAAANSALLAESNTSNDRTFASTAAGLAGTTSGQYFRVPQGSGATLSFIYYLNNSGTAQQVAEAPGKGFFTNNIRQFETLAIAQAEATAGNIPLNAHCLVRNTATDSIATEYVNTSGTLVPTNRVLVSLAYVNAQLQSVIGTGAAVQLSGYDSTAWAWVDSVGSSLLELLSDGTLNSSAVMLGNKIEFVSDAAGNLNCQLRGTSTVLFSLSTSGVFTFGENSTWTTDEDFFEGYTKAWLDAEGHIYKVEKLDGSIQDEMSDSTGGGGSDGASSDYPAVAAISDNIVAVQDDVMTQITADTDAVNTAPVAYKSFTRFLSNKSGSFLVHRASYDGKRRIRESKGVLLHGITVGQSLSPGGSTITQAPYTVAPEADYGIVCFATGPKVDFRYQSLDTSLLQTVIPCRENVGVRPGQESPASGMAWQLHKLTGHTVLVSTAGSSGTDIASISAGTASFLGATEMIKAGAALAEELGMVYKPVLILIHGNANAAAGTSITNYQAAMEGLRTSYQNVVRTVMNDSSYDLHMFLGQLSNTIPYGGTAGTTRTNNIGIAQYQQARDNDYTHIASVQYARPYSDGEHLTTSGYRTEGEIIGQTIANWLLDNTYQALMPDQENTVQSGTTITIPLKGGVGSPYIDTTRVVDPGNYGFVLTGATIASVAINGNSVVITKTDSSVATRVAYATTGIAGQNPGANTGSRGCIHDSATGNSATGLPLYNDLCVFAFDL